MKKNQILKFSSLILMCLTIVMMKFYSEKIFKLSGIYIGSELIFIKRSLMFFLFGIILEWKHIYTIFTKRKFKINLGLFVFGTALAVITFIPYYFWGIWFGRHQSYFIEFLEIVEIQLLLTTSSGIIMIRSLVTIPKDKL